MVVPLGIVVWQVAGVQYVLDSVVASLQEDPNRKFIYVEQVSLTPKFPFPCCDHRRSYDDRRFSYDLNLVLRLNCEESLDKNYVIQCGSFRLL